MVVGRVAELMSKLGKGKWIDISIEDLHDSAKSYQNSRIFDHVRAEYIDKVVAEVNSREYPGFELWKSPGGRWTLSRSL